MVDAEKPIHRGNQAFIDEDFPATLQAYGEAVSLGGEGEAVARSNRAAVYLKLGKYTEALQDVSAAVKLLPTEIALYRKGLAAFALEEFETALEAFRRGQALENDKDAAGDGDSGSGGGSGGDPRKYRTWIRKCEAELEAEEEAQAAATAAAAAATDRGVPTNGEVAPVSGGSVGGASSAVAAAGTAKRTPVLATSSAPAHLRIKFQYYQSYEKVTVAVLEKGLKESEVDVQVEAQRLTVRRKGDAGGGGGGALLFDKVLYEEVLPEKCRKRFMASKLEVTMTKKSPADWPELEGTATPATRPAAAVTATTAPNASSASPSAAGAAAPVQEPPTKVPRPYSSTKDWDVVEKEVQKELDSEKPEGEQALNDLFKSIYGKADEDTRRAMVKSFQTSGGTVLSTNWDEVGKADYEKERQAPKGMEWKTWEGAKLPQKDDDDDN